jgi:hypothetical protein
VSESPPEESDAVAEPPVPAKRGDRVALAGGYLLTGLVFVGTTGLMWSAAVAGLVGGVVVRTIYVGIRNRNGGSRPILSPWTLLLASFFAAAALGGLRTSEQEETDAFVVSMCVAETMHSCDVLAVPERRFSRQDFQKFSDRYCRRALDSGLISDAGVVGSQPAFTELSDSVVAAMLKSGEIREL